MRPRTLAHVSDLHIGKSSRHDAAAVELALALERCDADHVVVTGDITHSGRHSQLDRFFSIFAPLFDAGRVSLVPGNHDRVGEDAGARLIHGDRVAVDEAPGLYIVLVDSTAPHNRSPIAAHGTLSRQVLEEVYLALAAAPDDALRVVALHHHLVPLPEESFFERVSSWLRLPNAAELHLGAELLGLLQGRCELVLHGHRHVPAALRLAGPSFAPLQIFNAGCSTELERFRLFEHRAGVMTAPRWVTTDPRRAAAGSFGVARLSLHGSSEVSP